MHTTHEGFEDDLMRAPLGDAADPDPLFWDKTHPKRTDDSYKQVVVYCGVDLDERRLTVFKNMITDEFGLSHPIAWIGIVKTFKTPGEANTGGRHDAFFLVHTEDLPKLYSARRIHIGFSWWFDVAAPDTNMYRLYPRAFRQMYPRLG